MKVQHDQILRRIKEFPDIRILDELVQRRIEEVKLQLYSGPKQAAARVSNSLLSEAILECVFSKKFTTLTFDYDYRINNPV